MSFGLLGPDHPPSIPPTLYAPVFGCRSCSTVTSRTSCSPAEEEGCEASTGRPWIGWNRPRRAWRAAGRPARHLSMYPFRRFAFQRRREASALPQRGSLSLSICHTLCGSPHPIPPGGAGAHGGRQQLVYGAGTRANGVQEHGGPDWTGFLTSFWSYAYIPLPHPPLTPSPLLAHCCAGVHRDLSAAGGARNTPRGASPPLRCRITSLTMALSCCSSWTSLTSTHYSSFFHTPLSQLASLTHRRCCIQRWSCRTMRGLRRPQRMSKRSRQRVSLGFLRVREGPSSCNRRGEGSAVPVGNRAERALIRCCKLPARQRRASDESQHGLTLFHFCCLQSIHPAALPRFARGAQHKSIRAEEGPQTGHRGVFSARPARRPRTKGPCGGRGDGLQWRRRRGRSWRGGARGGSPGVRGPRAAPSRHGCALWREPSLLSVRLAAAMLNPLAAVDCLSTPFVISIQAAA